MVIKACKSLSLRGAVGNDSEGEYMQEGYFIVIITTSVPFNLKSGFILVP